MPKTGTTVRSGSDRENEAFRRATTALSNSAEEFAAYAAGDVRRAQESLAKAEADPADPAFLEAIFAIAHNFKGTGRLFGYDLLTRIGESLCDYLRDRSRRPNARLDVVRVHVSALDFVVENRIQGHGGEAGVRLLAKLDALRAEVA